MGQYYSFDQKCKSFNSHRTYTFDRMSVLPRGLISRTCRSARAATPTFTMAAPAPQKNFVHTPLVTEILGHPLIYIKMRPHVSFAVAPCRLWKPSGVSHLANIGHPRKAAKPKLKNVLAAVPRAETLANGQGRPRTTNGERRFKAARPSALNSLFCYSLRFFLDIAMYPLQGPIPLKFLPGSRPLHGKCAKRSAEGTRGG